jgi:hypothetical protein
MIIIIILALLIIACFFLVNFSEPDSENINALVRHNHHLERTIQWICRYPNDMTVMEIQKELEKEKAETEKEIEELTKI